MRPKKVFPIIYLILTKILMTQSSVMKKEGDLNIGALMPVTAYTNEAVCGEELSSAFFVEIAQSIQYGIDRVNADPGLLPNITLGYVILDTCNKATAAVARSMQFLPADLQFQCGIPNEFQADVCQVGNEIEEHYDVIGVLAPPISTEAIATSPIMQLYNIPHISALASSDVLSDKSRYPYFFRVTPPDKYRADSMVAIAVHFNWTYVSLVYKDDLYGRNGADRIKLRLNENSICMASVEAIPLGSSNKYYNGLVERLWVNRNARVILAFITVDEAIEIKKALKRNNMTDFFIWLTTGSGYDLSPGGGTVLVVSQGDFDYEPLNDYYVNLTVENNPDNPWFPQAWENYFGCTWNVTSSPRKPSCEDFPKLEKSERFRPKSVASQFLDSIDVLANALHRLLNDTCPRAFQITMSPKQLRACVDGRKFHRYIQMTSFQGLNKFIEFNNEGDIISAFRIEEIIDGFKVGSTGTWDMRTDTVVMDYFPNWRHPDDLKEDKTKPNKQVIPNSECSQPCLPGYRYVGADVKCCWECLKCRPNEVTDSNQTGCEECRPFHWPESINRTHCLPMIPDYLEILSPIGTTILTLVIVGVAGALSLAGLIYRNRREKLIKASGVAMSSVVIVGVLVEFICAGANLVTPSVASCLWLRFGMSCGFALVYAPVLIKSTVVFRIFTNTNVTKLRFISPTYQLVFTAGLLLLQVSLFVFVAIISPPEPLLRMPVSTEPYVELMCKFPTWVMLTPLSYSLLLIMAACSLAFKTRRLPENYNESWFIFLSSATTVFLWVAFLTTYFTTFYAYQKAIVLSLVLILNALIVALCMLCPKIYAVYFVNKSAITYFNTNLHTHSSSAVHPSTLSGISAQPQSSNTMLTVEGASHSNRRDNVD